MMKMRLKTAKVDYILLGLSLVLLLFGLIALSSASSVLSYQRYGHNYFYILRQFLYGVVPGLAMMYAFSKINYHFWQKIVPILVLAAIALLVAVLIPGIGFKVGNARRWIDFGQFFFQPAEVVKLIMIFYLASWYDKRQHHASDFYYGLLPSLVTVAVIAFLIVMEPDIGTMLVLVLIALVMFFIGGAKLRHIAYIIGAGLAGMWLLIKTAPYRLERIISYFNPTIDTKGISYQINQALLAIGSGGLWGTGYGQSRQKYNYLPEPIGDSIFAIMSEELGFIRIAFLLLLLLFFAYRGFRIASQAPDTFGKLAAAGIVSWITFQALINIGGITAVIPLTGIPLPFVSYGSSAMAVTLAGVGVLLNISRHAQSQT